MDEKTENRKLRIYAGISTGIIIVLLIAYFMFPKTIIQIKNIPVNHTIYINQTICTNLYELYFIQINNTINNEYPSLSIYGIFNTPIGKQQALTYSTQQSIKYDTFALMLPKTIIINNWLKNKISIFYVSNLKYVGSAKQTNLNITEYNVSYGGSITINRTIINGSFDTIVFAPKGYFTLNQFKNFISNNNLGSAGVLAYMGEAFNYCD